MVTTTLSGFVVAVGEADCEVGAGFDARSAGACCALARTGAAKVATQIGSVRVEARRSMGMRAFLIENE